jgi:hypothetical protein
LSLLPRCHFLHIGKTGGSAIKEAIHLSNCCSYELILHRHNTTLFDIPLGERVIFFVRDPISRFVSGFYSRQRKGQPRYFQPWSDLEARAFSAYSTANELARDLNSENADRVGTATIAMQSIQHVCDSYWNWFGDKSTFEQRLPCIMFVGSQENMSEDFSTLKKLLGIDNDIALPTDPVLAHRNPSSVDCQLEDRARRALTDWYLKDYEFLELLGQHFSNLPKYYALSDPRANQDPTTRCSPSIPRKS